MAYASTTACARPAGSEPEYLANGIALRVVFRLHRQQGATGHQPELVADNFGVEQVDLSDDLVHRAADINSEPKIVSMNMPRHARRIVSRIMLVDTPRARSVAATPSATELTA